MCKFWLFSNRLSRAHLHTREKPHKGTSKFSNNEIFQQVYALFTHIRSSFNPTTRIRKMILAKRLVSLPESC